MIRYPITEQKIRQTLSLWSFLGDFMLQPIHGGASNTTYRVEGDAGKFFVKLYGNSTATAQIYYEHKLLEYLHLQDLSFAVAVPLPTSAGETLVNLEDIRIALFPLLTGQPVDKENLVQVAAVGRALGELHHALGEFDPTGEMALLPSWGELDRIHPSIKDPWLVPEIVGLDQKKRSHFHQTLSEALAAKPHLYATLPVQTIHGDYLPPNALLQENRVSAVLDFEFATRDLRLIDYICGLDNFTASCWRELPRWQFIQAFSQGYREQVSLTRQEAEALMITWRLQWLSSIIYWTGWLQQGKGCRQNVLDGINKLFRLEDWFQDNATKLLEYNHFG